MHSTTGEDWEAYETLLRYHPGSHVCAVLACNGLSHQGIQLKADEESRRVRHPGHCRLSGIRGWLRPRRGIKANVKNLEGTNFAVE